PLACRNLVGRVGRRRYNRSGRPRRPPRPRMSAGPSDVFATLSESGVLLPEQAAELEKHLADGPADQATVIRAAAERGWLTAFQADRLAQGRPRSLVLGPYALRGPPGGGGRGRVSKARHRRLDRLVALKFIRPDRLAGAGAVERFQREARAAARMQHPNLV